jgi:hypothetical protein
MQVWLRVPAPFLESHFCRRVVRACVVESLVHVAVIDSRPEHRLATKCDVLLVHKDKELPGYLVKQITNDLEMSSLVDVESGLRSRTEAKFFDGRFELGATCADGSLKIA